MARTPFVNAAADGEFVDMMRQKRQDALVARVDGLLDQNLTLAMEYTYAKTFEFNVVNGVAHGTNGDSQTLRAAAFKMTEALLGLADVDPKKLEQIFEQSFARFAEKHDLVVAKPARTLEA
jgi:hypothetical protein